MSLNEIKNILESLAKYKIRGVYGWTIKFFLAFFNLMEYELLEVAEDSRLKGRVTKDLNAYFLPLIPKCDKPTIYN